MDNQTDEKILTELIAAQNLLVVTKFLVKVSEALGDSAIANNSQDLHCWLVEDVARPVVTGIASAGPSHLGGSLDLLQKFTILLINPILTVRVTITVESMVKAGHGSIHNTREII